MLTGFPAVYHWLYTGTVATRDEDCYYCSCSIVIVTGFIKPFRVFIKPYKSLYIIVYLSSLFSSIMFSFSCSIAIGAIVIMSAKQWNEGTKRDERER